MSLDYLLVGRRIRRLRKAKKWSQEQLAERTGTSSGFISLVERGEKGLSVEGLVRMANVLGVTADALLGENLKNIPNESENELTELLKDCNDFERRVILESARELKRILKESASVMRKKRNDSLAHKRE